MGEDDVQGISRGFPGAVALATGGVEKLRGKLARPVSRRAQDAQGPRTAASFRFDATSCRFPCRQGHAIATGLELQVCCAASGLTRCHPYGHKREIHGPSRAYSTRSKPTTLVSALSWRTSGNASLGSSPLGSGVPPGAGGNPRVDGVDLKGDAQAAGMMASKSVFIYPILRLMRF
jgi:hypothetical protein